MRVGTAVARLDRRGKIKLYMDAKGFARADGIEYYGVDREKVDSARFAKVFADLRIIVVVETMDVIR